MLTERRSTILTLAAVLLAVFLAFSPALKGAFLTWDDDVHLLNNLSVRGLDQEHVHDMFTGKISKIYIPLTTFSFAVEYHFFGYRPFIYHLDNLLLHLCVVALVFFFARRLGLSLIGSAVTSLLFGLHPVHVESVVWVTERKDVLYALFYMLALISYLKYLSSWQVKEKVKVKPAYGYLMLTFLLGILSMLAKPMAVSLPFILIILDWFIGRKYWPKTSLEKLPLFVVLGALAWLSYSENQSRISDYGQSFLIWVWTFVFYLRQFILPLVVVPIHDLPRPIAFMNVEYLLSLLVFLTVIVSIFRLRQYRWFIFMMAFYFFSVFFLLRVEDVADTIGSSVVADRFLYLPCLGFCLAIGAGFEKILEKKGFLHSKINIKLYWGVLLILLSVLGFRTYQLSKVWGHNISLWQHELKFFPDQPLAVGNLASALVRTDEYIQANKMYKEILQARAKGLPVKDQGSVRAGIQKTEYLLFLYEKSVKVSPRFAKGQYNLGWYYKSLGLYDQAMSALQKTIQLDPADKDAFLALGELYSETKDSARSIQSFDHALTLYPDDEDLYINILWDYNEILKKKDPDRAYRKARDSVIERYTQMITRRHPRVNSWMNLGIVYSDAGEFDRAVSAYQMALDLNPNNSHVLYNLGNAYKGMGRLDDALAVYQKSVELDPKKSDAYLNMGSIYVRLNDNQKAKAFFEQAMHADPKNAKAYFNWAYMDEAAGNNQRAQELYQKSIELDPQNAEGYYNLGNVFAKLNLNEKAKQSYLKAVDVNPNHLDAWVNLSVLSFHDGDYAGAVKYCDEAVLLGYDAPAGYLKALEPYRKK